MQYYDKSSATYAPQKQRWSWSFLCTFAFQNQTKISRFVKRVTKMSGVVILNLG